MKKYKGAFIISVADIIDAVLISHTFGANGTGTFTKPSTGERDIVLRYKDADYKHLATKLGC